MFLESTDIDFDVLVLSKTHILHNIDDFNIQEYLIFWNESVINKFDGCIVYFKEKYYQESALI